MSQSKQIKILFTTNEAAEYLGFAANTLSNSRYTGLLGGVKSPPYRKLGKSIRYEKSGLDTWTGQFKVQTNTSETPNNAA